ncbi:MAG: methionyl-tRNA formyltransferase [Planctomycetota bacterium]|nr:methionyl-tRNA formyltransferase [Planctomycetota bacterium]
MRIVFAGSGTFGVPSLGALVEGGQEVVLVVTQPDRPAGRGRSLRIGSVKRFAKDRGIPVFQPEDVNAVAAVRRIRTARPDLLLVVAYGQILGRRLLQVPPYGAVNLHGSILPKYRGAAPINWAVIHGETETGLSVIEMTEEMDAGDILGQRATPIGPDETAGQLHDRLAELGARLVTEVVREIPLDEVAHRRQNETQVTFAPRLKKTHGRIDWDKPAADVYNQVRGVTPWPGAFTFLPAGRKKRPLRVVVDRAARSPASPSKAAPGEVVSAGADGIDVVCATGAVRILELTPAGKRRMGAADFLNGHPLASGDRFLGKKEKAGARRP